MQRCRSFICLRAVNPVPPPWHNAEDNARVPPHQTLMRNGEKGEKEGVGRDRCRAQKYNAGRNMIGHQSQTELVEKKLSLKLIIYPGEEKPQPHPLFPLFSAPCVAWCQLSTLHQCLRLHAASEASFCRSRSNGAVYLTA